jgi:DNA-binding CsgD family transcriptional regulator
VTRPAGRTARAPLPRVPAEPLLTARQRRELLLVATGLTRRRIATRLGIGYETLATHLGVIYRRLGVHSSQEAVGRWLVRPEAEADRAWLREYFAQMAARRAADRPVRIPAAGCALAGGGGGVGRARRAARSVPDEPQSGQLPGPRTTGPAPSRAGD